MIYKNILICFSFIFIIGCSSQESEINQQLEANKKPIILDKISDPEDQLIYFHDYLKYAISNWEKDLGIDFHIVVVNKPTVDIVVEAQQLFQDRNIGKNTKTGGVLILLKPGSNQARIAVSHNLEVIFTDAVVGSIAKSQLAPYISYNMAGMAIMDTMHFLKDHLLAMVAAGNFQLENYYREKSGNKTILGFYSGGGGGSTIIPDIDFNNNWKQKPSNSEMVKYLPGSTPSASIEVYTNSLKNMVGYPDLPVLTEGSQIMKESYPFAPYEAYLRYLRIENSKPLSLMVEGKRAVAVSQNPALGYHPIMLKKVDEKWLVDLTEMLKNMFFDGNGDFYQKNMNHPYSFAFKNTQNVESYDISALALPELQSLKQILDDLKQMDADGTRVFLIAELLFRNAFSSMESLEYYEKAVALEPNNKLYKESLIKRYRYLGMNNLAVMHAKKVDEFRIQLATPLTVDFSPTKPVIHFSKPTKVGEFVVYDHSEFSIKLTNNHFSPIHIKSVIFSSLGNRQKSGLGDIINYWPWGDSATLESGKSISFNKVWGFTVDTPNTEMTSQFKFTYTIGFDSEEQSIVKNLVLIPDA